MAQQNARGQNFVTQIGSFGHPHASHSFSLRSRAYKNKKNEVMNSMMNFEEIKKKLIREYQTNKTSKKVDDKTYTMGEPSKQTL